MLLWAILEQILGHFEFLNSFDLSVWRWFAHWRTQNFRHWALKCFICNLSWITGLKVSAAGPPPPLSSFLTTLWADASPSLPSHFYFLTAARGVMWSLMWSGGRGGAEVWYRCQLWRRAKISEDSTKAGVDPGSAWWWNLTHSSSDLRPCWELHRGEDELMEGAWKGGVRSHCACLRW